MAKVTAKKSNLTGFVLGVEFTDGHAETEAPAALAFFAASQDYTVGASAKSEPASPAPKP